MHLFQCYKLHTLNLAVSKLCHLAEEILVCSGMKLLIYSLNVKFMWLQGIYTTILQQLNLIISQQSLQHKIHMVFTQ